jgi:hypothetical protein
VLAVLPAGAQGTKWYGLGGGYSPYYGGEAVQQQQQQRLYRMTICACTLVWQSQRDKHASLMVVYTHC